MDGFQTQTVVVPAGASGVRVPIRGKWVDILTCTAATVGLAFDGGPAQVAYPAKQYPGPKAGFQSLHLIDTSGAGCSVVVMVSDERIGGEGANVLQSIDDRLARIDQEISGGAVAAQLASVNVPITGGAGLQLFAANAARVIVSLTARDDNGGLVFIGEDATVSHTNYMDFIYPGGNWFEERYKGAIFAVGDDAGEWVGGYEV